MPSIAAPVNSDEECPKPKLLLLGRGLADGVGKKGLAIEGCDSPERADIEVFGESGVGGTTGTTFVVTVEEVAV